LARQLAELLAPPSGLIALAARHVESGRTWRHQEHHVLPAASLIKLPILAAFWETIRTGQIDPEERVRVPFQARVEGTGVLKALAPNLEPTWNDLATLMITVSDNVATNLIIDQLGFGAIQSWIERAGLGDTRLARRMLDRAAMTAGQHNVTSAADMEALLLSVATGTCVSAHASRQMRRALDAQQIQDRLARRVPDAVRVVNKTGNLDDVIHDAGILMWPGGTLVVAVLTQGVRPAWHAMDTIADVAVALLAECGK
jgi:beta-lactamase class A